ncbi:hypothetical protein BGZ83_010939 [Gryganskiella cystojenkinii]|nr:hypothetical protein BGZ83_010939 [Gryganskiella cystojenkinii]
MASATTVSSSSSSPQGAVDTQTDNSARHIFTVAARSLQDCAELLLSLKAAIAAEKEEEERQANSHGNGHGNGHSHGNSNGNSHHLVVGSGDGRSGSNGSSTSTSKGARPPSTLANMREIHHMSRTGSQDSENSGGDGQEEHTTTTTTDNNNFSSSNGTTAKAKSSASACVGEEGLVVLRPCKKSEMYTKPSLLACKGTIGKHVRHLHDHYRLLFSTYPPAQGLARDSEWSVDYDKRSREVPMETDIEYAIQELERLQYLLERYQDPTSASHNSNGSNRKGSDNTFPTDLSQLITLQATIDPTHAPVGFQTTFGRELWFCSLHAVHHFAMIKVICSEFGMPLKDGFGFAPSTLKNQKETHAGQ